MINQVKNLTLIIVLSLLTNCSQKNDIKKLFPESELKEWTDVGEDNPNVLDNRIYKSKRRFSYRYSSHINNVEYENYFYVKEDNSLDVFKAAIETNNGKNYYKMDYLTLDVFATKGSYGSSLGNSQTIIKYSFWSSFYGKFFLPEFTGVLEDSKQVFIHPPRSFGFGPLQFTAFPKVDLPLKLNKEWTVFFSIPNEIVQKQLGLNISVNQNLDYKVVDKVKLSTELGELDCWKINAKAIEVKGEINSESDYWFNEDYGFVRMKNTIMDSIEMNLELIKVTNRI